MTVTFNGKTVKTKADSKGAWKTHIGPLTASSKGTTLTIADGADSKTLNDVLVGEVWFASGQSNMHWSVAQSGNVAETMAAADLPGVRFFSSQLTAVSSPMSDVEGQWEISSPQTAGRFSAVAYHFARKLNQELGVPVGVIQSAWGGKPVQTFTSREALASIPEGKSLLEAQKMVAATYDPEKAKAQHAEAMKTWRKQMQEKKAATPDPQAKPPAQPKLRENPASAAGQPATIYNGMIAPFVGYTMRGAIWHQGEGNAKSQQTSLDYGKLFPLMIRDWRTRWGDDFSFLWAQLANYRKPVEEPGTNDPWAILQDQQRRILSIDRTGMAVINDIGTENNIHPPNKKDVGERLSRWALADEYGKDVVKCGPLYKTYKIEGSRIIVTFDHTAKGLKSVDGGPLKRLEIRGGDGKWEWADAKIEGNAVVVSSANIAKPVAARYAWACNPTGANLVNSEGLPASDFTTEQESPRASK